MPYQSSWEGFLSLYRNEKGVVGTRTELVAAAKQNEMVELAERESCLMGLAEMTVVEVGSSLEGEELGWGLEVTKGVVVMAEVVGMKNWKEGRTPTFFSEDGVPAQKTPPSP